MFFRKSHHMHSEAEAFTKAPDTPPRTATPTKRRRRCLLYVGILWGILLVLGLISPPPKSAGRSTASRTNTTITDEHIGCVSRPFFDKLVRYIAQGDLQALNAAFIPARLNGTCTKFQKGEPVHLVEAGLFSGTIKVRRPGEIVEYFTLVEAIR
jgi:hypothetical protein